jgi:hypothetical protein
MAAKAVRTHGPCTCAVEVVPGEVDAGAELTVRVRVSCSHGCDLTGHGVSIRDEGGTALAGGELSELDGDAYVTGAIVVPAPLKTGEHAYRAVLAARKTDGVLHEETASAFSFVTVAHAASLNVWGMPSAIAAGERFRLKVGIKCSAGCKLAGRALSIHDDEGVQVAAGRLRADVWSGTSALYYAELEVQAPPEAGDYTWQVQAPGSDTGVPHADGVLTFALKVVSRPDHEVTVEAFDSEKHTPIEGVHVLLHPYRAFTDANGVAKVKVAKGRYTLFVSGFNYIAHEAIIDVAGDVTARAELTVEPEGQEDYR